MSAIPVEASTASAAAPTDAPVTADVAPLPTNVACGAEEPLPALAPSAATAPVSAPDASADGSAAEATATVNAELPVQGTSAARMTTTAEAGEDDARGAAPAETSASAAGGASNEDVEMGEAGDANGSA